VIGDKDLALAGKMLDILSTQHKLSAHNLANADVQGFRPLKADFRKELARAIESGDTKALKEISVEVERARQPGVDSEREVARMAKNEVMFNTFAEIAAFRLRMLRSAVTSK